MTRSRHPAPPRGVPVLLTDELAAKRERQQRHIADSLAERDAKRSAAAATCADLQTSLLASIRSSRGVCPTCGEPWGEHAAGDLEAHVLTAYGVGANNNDSPNGAA